MDLTCACGKTLHVPERLLGKQVRCPGCGTAIRAVAPEPVEGAAAPQRMPPAKESPTPQAAVADKPVSKRALPWFGLAVGVGCCGFLAGLITAGAVVAFFYLKGGSSPAPQANSTVPAAAVKTPPANNSDSRQKTPDSQAKTEDSNPAPNNKQAPTKPAPEKKESPNDKPAPFENPEVADGPPATLFLEAGGDPPDYTISANHGILLREIVRQAFLMAARDLNLDARDGGLEELPPDGLPDRNKVRVNSLFNLVLCRLLELIQRLQAPRGKL